MLASAFVARHRRVHSRGTRDATAGREEQPLAAVATPPYRTHGRRRATPQDAPLRSGGGSSVRRPRHRRWRVAEAGAEQGPGAGTEEAAAPGPEPETSGEATGLELEDGAASVASSVQLCAVCLDDLRGGATAALPCSHAYRPGCVGPWLAVHRACPCCRAAVPNSPPPQGGHTPGRGS